MHLFVFYYLWLSCVYPSFLYISTFIYLRMTNNRQSCVMQNVIQLKLKCKAFFTSITFGLLVSIFH